MAAAGSPLADIEDLTLCSLCKQPFNDTDQQPKVLSCKHHFCLKCVNLLLLKGHEQAVQCMHCWKRTEVPELRTDALPTYTPVLALAQRLGSLGPLAPLGPQPSAGHKKKAQETCAAHAMPHSLWCHSCATPICRACAAHPDHQSHTVKPQADAKHLLRQDFQQELANMQKMLQDIQMLVGKQRDFLLKILDACTTLKTQVETDLVNNMPGYELAEARDCLHKAHQSYGATDAQSPREIHALLSALAQDKERLQHKYHEMFLQCKLDDLIKNSTVVFDFELLKRALAGIHSGEVSVQNENRYYNPILFLANYCMSQLYSRHFLFKQQQQQQQAAQQQQQQQQNNSHPFLHGQNGNLDYAAVIRPPSAPTTYAPLAMPNSNKNGSHGLSENSLLKTGVNSYGSDHPGDSLPSLNMSKLSLTDNCGGSLNSPNLNKDGVPFPGDVFSNNPTGLLPTIDVNPVSPQRALVPGLLPPTVMHHSPQPTMIRNPPTHIYPIFYFNIEINGAPFGRILIEVRSDVAPKMAKNFSVLSTGELGIGYKGCNIFQCWENESIITGDFELNNGRGGRSIFEESFFMPDDTKILATRGSVGMRRSQKRHDNLGLVGSQFRIILREMRGFTGIFAFVVEGLELVDRISQSGDSAGKPQSNILIASCGKLN